MDEWWDDDPDFEELERQAAERRVWAEDHYDVPGMIDPDIRKGFRTVEAKVRDLETVIEDLAQQMWHLVHRDKTQRCHVYDEIPDDLHDAVGELWMEASGYHAAAQPMLRLAKNMELGAGIRPLFRDDPDTPGWLPEAELRTDFR